MHSLTQLLWMSIWEWESQPAFVLIIEKYSIGNHIDVGSKPDIPEHYWGSLKHRMIPKLLPYIQYQRHIANLVLQGEPWWMPSLNELSFSTGVRFPSFRNHMGPFLETFWRVWARGSWKLLRWPSWQAHQSVEAFCRQSRCPRVCLISAMPQNRDQQNLSLKYQIISI